MTGPTICLDFDGVLHSYTSGWKGEDVIPDPPVDGAHDACEAMLEAGYEVVVFSTRGRSGSGIKAMVEWLHDHGFPKDLRVCTEKPPAILYVDDRGWRFDGTWSELLLRLTADKVALDPWFKSGRERPIHAALNQAELESARFRAALIQAGNQLVDGVDPKEVVSFIQAVTSKPLSEAYREYVRLVRVYCAAMATPARDLPDGVLNACMWVAADVARGIPGVKLEYERRARSEERGGS